MTARRRVSSLLPLVAIALVPLVASAPAARAADSAPVAAKIGVVNLSKIFDSLQEMKDIRARIDSQRAELQSTAQAHQAELNDLKQKLQNLKPDAPQYDDQAQHIEQIGVQYDNELKLKQFNLARDVTHQIKSVYDKVESTVGDIAKTQGLDLVLTAVRPEFPPNVRDMTPEAIQNLIGQRNVMYLSDKVDITSQVVTAMDAKYKAGGK